MPEISKVTLPNGNQYDLKDAQARQDISNLKLSTNSVMSYIGTTTTALTDGATTSPITIGSGNDAKQYTPSQGDVVVYNDVSYAWTGTQWDQYGSAGALKALAYKDSASGSVKTSGSVSQPSFTGSAATITTSITPKGTVSVSSGDVTSGKTANYTPKGTVSQPSFTGTQGTVSVSGTPKGTVAISEGTSGNINYTPKGNISVSPNVTLNTTTVNSITGVGTLPAWSATVSGENLQFSWAAGSLPTKGANTTVATSVKSATATGSFTGTGADLEASFTGQSSSSTGNFTPSGTVSKPSFTGTGAVLSGSFTGEASTGSASYTPSGTVSKPTFSGDTATVTVK